MSAIYPQPSPIRWISGHALDQYKARVNANHPRCVARVAIMRMVRASQVMTEHQLKYYHVRIDLMATYYLSESSAGRYLLLVKDGALVTLWLLA